MHNVKLEVVSEDGLCKETYQYYPFRKMDGNDQSIRLVLDIYVLETRPSTRHKWRIDRSYNRLSRSRFDSCRREDVPTPEHVRQAVLKRFVDSITIE